MLQVSFGARACSDWRPLASVIFRRGICIELDIAEGEADSTSKHSSILATLSARDFSCPSLETVG